jgi:hypothetical protein
MTQALILAELILKRTVRSKIVPAMILASLPVFLAAYLFDAANPGFQTLFIKDVVGAFLGICALLMLGLLALENIFWPGSGTVSWFIASRVKNRLHLFVGQTMGITLSVMAVLVTVGGAMFVLLRLTHGAWFWEILYSIWMITLESAVLTSLLILLSTVFSKFMSLSMVFILYLLASTAIIKGVRASCSSDLTGFVISLVLALIPDSSMFSVENLLLERQVLNLSEAMVASFYAFFIMGFYLLMARLVSNRWES